MKMKLTGKQREELRVRISALLLDENKVGDMPAFIWANLDWKHEEAEVGWWSMPDDVERVTNKIIEAIELD